MPSVNLVGNGFNESVAVTGNKTLAASDSGVAQKVTATATITLPAVGASASNLSMIVYIGDYGLTVNISPNSADKIVGNGFTAADDKDMIFTSQPAGSYVHLISSNEATTDSCWVVQRISGVATREA